MHDTRGGLWAEQVGGTDLGTGGTECHRGSDPRASAIPPAAMTGTLTACTTCGTRATVPSYVVRSSDRKMPRCPPASRPCAMMASTPCASSQHASSTVVADERMVEPHVRTCASSAAEGRPK